MTLKAKLFFRGRCSQEHALCRTWSCTVWLYGKHLNWRDLIKKKAVNAKDTFFYGERMHAQRTIDKLTKEERDKDEEWEKQELARMEGYKRYSRRC